MRLGCLLWFLAFALLWGGGQATFTGFTNRKKTVVSAEELYQKVPDSKWVKVTGGQLNLLDSAYTSFLGTDPSSLYIPILPAPAEDSADESPTQIRLLLHTEKKSYLKTLKEFEAFTESSNLNEAAIIEKVASMSDQLFPVQDVEGLVQFGIDSGSEEQEVRDLFDNLHPDCLIIEDGQKPSMLLGLLAFVAGIVLLFVLTRGMRTRKVAPLAVPPSSPPPPLNPQS